MLLALFFLSSLALKLKIVKKKSVYRFINISPEEAAAIIILFDRFSSFLGGGGLRLLRTPTPHAFQSINTMQQPSIIFGERRNA